VKGYFDRLAARLVEPRPLIRPRPLSRFEATDPLTAPTQEPAMAGEEDTLRTRPARAAVDRGDAVRPSASITPPAHTEAIARAHPRPASVTNVIPAAPSARDARTSAPPEAGTPARRELASQLAEPVDAPVAHRPASTHPVTAATPSPIEVLSQRPSAAVPPSPVPTVQDTTARPGIADRISPWRAPDERAALPPIDTRTSTQAPIAGVVSQHRDKPGAAADHSPAVVQVTIGRLEVRAPEVARRPFAKPTRAAPRMSLQDYLQRRTEGPRR
jgi:hypothetical protein